MATINTLVNAGKYYNLTDTSGNKAHSGSGTSILDPASTSSNLAATSAAAQAGSYLLDLSPEAQNYLNTLKSSDTKNQSGFHLTAQQQEVMDSILAKYKDAPYNDETFAKIQDDLDAAGLSPEKLALENNLRNFSATNILLAALNGQDIDTNVTPESIMNSQKNNTDSYMKSIAEQWQKISTTADNAEESGSADA